MQQQSTKLEAYTNLAYPEKCILGITPIIAGRTQKEVYQLVAYTSLAYPD